MTSINGEIDTYGFERGEDFDYTSYEEFMSEYLGVLSKRLRKWERLVGHRGNADDNNKIVRRSRKTKRYVRKGIPAGLRGDVWMSTSKAAKAIALSPDVYADMLSRSATELDKRVADAIQMDIRRTYPENINFKEIMNDNLLPSLKNVLSAYALYRPVTGYCQGLNYVAGMLLLIRREEQDAFWLLAQLMQRSVPDYYSNDMRSLRVDCHALAELVALNEPELHAHLNALFTQNSVTLEIFVSKWFVCLFVDVLPVETCLRVWDCLFYEGSKILLRVAYTLIVRNKAAFMQLQDFVAVCNLFKSVPQDKSILDCHAFLQECFTLPKQFSSARIQQFREKAAQNLAAENGAAR